MIRQSSKQNRRGVSILEVLFAILISSIGLMGAIAVFPAALMQTKRGQQADMTAMAGQAGYHTFDAMGMRRADRWMYFEPTRPSPPSTAGGPGYWPINEPYNVGPYTTMNPPLYRYHPITGDRAFCIDPRYCAANPATGGAVFPYGSATSRMLRVTLENGASSYHRTPMPMLQANLQFSVEDDLAYDRFTGTFNGIDQSTQQAASLFARGAPTALDPLGPPLKRESHGHMSWMATLSPKIERLQTGGAVEDRYVLSVVVFYDRPAQLEVNSGFDASEWELSVSAFHGSGIGGGDMQLRDTSGSPAEEQLRRLTIHRDQWIMLMSNAPAVGANGREISVCRWYRVIDSDEPNGNNVDVTLAGADWEFGITPPPPNQPPTTAIICQGVVAVFEKTIKLEPRN
jgi:type II secretory pathway pseudopilin PulG